jgi:hypothetical protein
MNFVLSENVATFNVSENAKITADGITVDPTATTAPLNNFKSVKAINVNNGVVTGVIDASKAADPVNITATGDKAEITGNVTTKGNVTISSKSAGFQVITADGDIHISSEAIAQGVESKENKVTLTDKAQAVYVKAKGDIVIDKQAKNVGGAGVNSLEGDITINNEFTADDGQAGPIKADLGSVSLNQTGEKKASYTGAITAGTDIVISGNVATTGAITAGQDVELKGKAKSDGAITAGRDFTVKEEANANCGVTLKRIATVNITRKDGDALAVAGDLKFADGADYELNLLSGVVNSITNADGEVALHHATTAATTAIGLVSDPNNLKPTNKSIWTGKKLTVPNTYWEDNGRIWTAAQLGMWQGASAVTALSIRSDIDLNNEKWAGIEPAGDLTIYGNYKTISNVKAMGNKATKTAGFINKVGALTISKLTFDGVQTAITVISGGQYDGGIGAVAGVTTGVVNLTRVNVKLAGEKFGSDGVYNVQTANIGGVIGLTKDNTTFTGVTVDASATTLSGYKNMGGYIGSATSWVTVRMAEADGDDLMALPTVTGLKMNVTFDATENSGKVNDPYQGTTGHFIGAVDVSKTIAISDVNDVKPTLTVGGKVDEGKACKIQDPEHKFYFHRGDQTLIGNSGFELDAKKITINGNVYQIQKTGEDFTVGNPILYSLTDQPHVK